MKKLISFVTIISIVLLTILLIPKPAYASHIIFQDNFNSYPEGSIPQGWITTKELDRTLCNAHWRIHNGMLGISIIDEPSCTTNLVPDANIWKNLINNYSIEFDMRLVNGTDHNFIYRYTTSDIPFYEIHITSPGDISLNLPPNSFFNTNLTGNYINGNTYHIKIVVDGKNIQIFANDNLVKDVSLQDALPAGKIAFRAGTGANPNSETWFDNLIVTGLDSSKVSDFKQTDPTWSNNPNPPHGLNNYIYSTLLDHNSNCRDMYMWGCAITAVADVLKSYGFNTVVLKGNSIKQINPGSFNDWMTENNIFSECGALFQLMGQSVGIANPVPFWINNDPNRKTTAKIMIDDALTAGNLPIVGVNTTYGTHFIVLSKRLADLSDGTPDYLIIDPALYPFTANDPGNTGKTLSATYKWSDVYETIIFNKQSQPTAKTISFIGHSPIQMLITDPNGKNTGYESTANSYLNDIPESSYGADHGIADIDGQVPKAPESIIYDQNNPINGTYTLKAYGTGNGPYTIDFVSMAASESAVHHIISGKATTGKTDTYFVTISSNSSNPIIVQRNVTIHVIPNIIYPKAGILGVTIAGESGFDVKKIDVSTVRLGNGKAKPLNNKGFLIGNKKLLLLFDTKKVGIASSDTQLCLSGNTEDAIGFRGCNAITVILPKTFPAFPPFPYPTGNSSFKKLSNVHQLFN